MFYQQHAENDGCDEKFILSYERAKEMYNMDKNQNSYTSEFKQQRVDLYNIGRTSYLKLEREYGVNWSIRFARREPTC